jgi:sugar lactone lactonase YvrE
VPSGIYADGYGNLWVADAENERVCYYKKNAQGQFLFHRVIGQPNATTGTDHTASPQTLRHPQGVTLDSAGRLWIADTDNSRIVRVDNAVNQSADDPVFSGVLGQADFYYYGQGSPADELNRPRSLTCDILDRLWIADTDNNRVVRYDLPATGNQHPAQLVLGQTGFNSNIPNGTTLDYIQKPFAVSIDLQGCLWVADSGNGRVLRHTPNDPVTSSVSKISGIFRVQWSVEPGVVYRMQASASMTSWLSLGSVTAQSATVMYQDFINPGTSMFYRIAGP